MLHYITRTNCRFSVRGEDYQREAVTCTNPLAYYPPESHIYCGNVFWEIEIIRKRIDAYIVEVIDTEVIKHLLPLELRPSVDGVEVEAPLDRAWGPLGRSKETAWRIILINGAGTMLGDSLFGASVAAEIADLLQAKGLYLRFDVLLAVNAAEQSELIWKRHGAFDRVFRGALTLEALARYHAMIDFCQLLKLDGYATEHRFDFYLNHFGVHPRRVSEISKRPRIAVHRRALQEVNAHLNSFRENRSIRFTFLQPDASTAVRSMPEEFLWRLIEALARDPNRRIIGTSEMLRRTEGHPSIIDCHALTKGSLDHYLALLTVVDDIVSVDTLSLNVACGLRKSALGFFTQSDHTILSRYWSKLFPILLPEAKSLAFWHRHKSDDTWPRAEPSYRKAWANIELETVLRQWETFKLSQIESVPERLAVKYSSNS